MKRVLMVALVIRAFSALDVVAQDMSSTCGSSALQGDVWRCDVNAEIKNGQELVSWLKVKDGQTSLQNKDALAMFKGKYVILKGKVREVGRTMFGEEVYVSLTVGQKDMFERMNVQFNVPGPLEGVVKSWQKGEIRIMRGQVRDDGDLEDDASCINSEPVSEEKYRGACLVLQPSIPQTEKNLNEMNVDEMNEALRGSVRNILENALMRSAWGENAIEALEDEVVRAIIKGAIELMDNQ